MKKRIKSILVQITGLIVFSIFLTFSNLSCNSPTGPQDTPYITYIVSGGFTGGIHTKLVIDEYGAASLESEYPALKRQLTPEQYHSLLILFDDFEKLPDSAMIRCVDSFIYTVEYKVGSYTKIVSADNCALFDSTNFYIEKFKSIVNQLNYLANQIYNEQASWIGLTAEYKIDKNIYKIGEQVKLTYILKNPTNKERTMYFKNQYKFQFLIYKTDYPLVYYTYPEDYETNTTNPDKITLAPGEEKTINYIWDKKIKDHENWIQAPVGMYSISMSFVGGKVNGNYLFFDIIDPSIPIEGKVVPDYNGEGSYSKNYNFQLLVKNRMNSPVTLDFPNSQKISLQLYSNDIPSKRELLYESNLVIDNQSSQITIPAQGEETFSYVQNKDSLNLGDIYWFYVKIKLLAQNLNFEKDAGISIYQYSDNSNKK